MMKVLLTQIWRYMNKFQSYSTELINPRCSSEKLMVAGHPNIDTFNKNKENSSNLSDLCDTFSLKTLMASMTCVKTKASGSTMLFLLINQNISTIPVLLKLA